MSEAFVAESSGNMRLVVDYSKLNDCIEESYFRMEELTHLEPMLHRGDSLLKADIKDGYYSLPLRKRDPQYLYFTVTGKFYVTNFLNCGMSVAPRLFTKVRLAVVAYHRKERHRVCSYLEDFFGAAVTAWSDHPAIKEDNSKA